MGLVTGLGLSSKFRIVKRPPPKRDTASGVFEAPEDKR